MSRTSGGVPHTDITGLALHPDGRTAYVTDFSAGGIFLRGCQNCTFRNGSSGNRHDAYSQTIGAYSATDKSRNILIDNWLFHDMDR